MCTNANKRVATFKSMESMSAKAEERTSAKQGNFAFMREKLEQDFHWTRAGGAAHEPGLYRIHAP